MERLHGFFQNTHVVPKSMPTAKTSFLSVVKGPELFWDMTVERSAGKTGSMEADSETVA
jgi:hypothetical protein